MNYNLKAILINSAKLINQTTDKEKVIAQYMYVTAFCNLIRNGTIYRREDGIDGLPRLVIMLGNTEYKCPEYLAEKLINRNFPLSPYEDTSLHLDDVDPLPKPNYIDFTELENAKKKKNKKISSNEESCSQMPIQKDQELKSTQIQPVQTDKEIIKAEVEKELNKKLEKEKIKLQKKMDMQLAMDRKKQEELIIDEIDNTKMYKVVNIALGIFCFISSIAVWVFM